MVGEMIHIKTDGYFQKNTVNFSPISLKHGTDGFVCVIMPPGCKANFAAKWHSNPHQNPTNTASDSSSFTSFDV